MNDEKKVATFYCNNVDMQFSTFDFNFSFYLGEPENRELLTKVMMSPQHAKAFALVLGDNVKQYEALFGNINIQANPEEAKKLGMEPIAIGEVKP